MKRSSINLILLVALAIIVVMVVFVRRDYAERNDEWLPGMFRHVAFNSQSSNPNFTDGKTAQAPVSGSVARGYPPLDYNATPEDAARAGQELVMPPLAPAEVTADRTRGAMLFATFCSPCHGAGGLGDGVVAKRGYPPPPSLMAANARSIRDGQIFHIITYGQRTMPSLASPVTRGDRWRLVRHIRLLQSNNQPAP